MILNDADPIHWSVAGAAIGGITLLLLALTNKRLGISTGFESVCSLVVKPPYFRRSALVRSNPWRFAFLAGLLLGGVLSALSTGGWALTWDLGIFDTTFGWGPAGKVAWMFVGGLFIGVGTRMAGGCTSGHGIFGISNLEPSGLVSTVSFMAAGVVTTQVLYRVLGGLT